jgi:hypothetical protein
MPADRSRFFCRSLAAFAIVATAILRIVYLGWYCPLDLAPDEAHYWDWSRHLDWSYYSKGPLVALLIRGSLELFGSLSISLTGCEMLAVRFPAVLCGSLLVTSLYVLTVQCFGRERWALGVVLGALTFPVVAAGSSLMTIDGPFMASWGWALVFGHAAVFGERRWAWSATGVAIALGILAKHTMVLWLPCFGLFLLMTPAYRSLLLRPRFWLMVGIASLGALPILGWNVTHGWVTFLHTQGHAGMTSPKSIHWLGPVTYLATQFGLLFGFWFIAWVMAAVRFRPLGDARPEVRYLWWMSIPIVAFFGLFSLKNGGGEPNWPLAGYIAGVVLTAAWIAERLSDFRPLPRRLLGCTFITFAILGLVATVIVHEPVRFQAVFAALAPEATAERPAPLRRIDPTCRLRGWRTLGHAVDELRAQLRNRGIEPLLAATSWSMPGEVGFHCEGHPTVYSFGAALGDRHSQYDLWHPNPLAEVDDFRGSTFIVVGADAAILSIAFEQTETTVIVEHREGNQLIAVWPVTVAHGYRGFPTRDGRGF